MDPSPQFEEGKDRAVAKDLFATTRWTVVLTAGRPDTPEAEAALGELCATYWYALYAFARRQGHTREDAEDVVQGFFVSFLRRNYLDGLSREKGRFRAFLLTCFKHFLANEWDRAGRQKRGGQVLHLSLDWGGADTRYQLDPADHLTPDKLFDRAWAVALLQRVIERLQDASAKEGKLQQFEQLKPLLTAGKGAIPYRQIAQTLGISEPAARIAVHRLRRRFRDLLYEEIAQTLVEPGQVDEELRALLNAFCV